MAGVRLDEIFEYASTTREIDYDKYLAYAGLELEPGTERPEAYAGAIVEDKDGRLAVAAIEPHSPAAERLLAGDTISAVGGRPVGAAGFDAAVAAAHPGGELLLTIARKGATADVRLPLTHRVERTFRIRPLSSPSPLQAAILASWVSPSR